MPQRHVHFHAARGGDIAEVNNVLPTEPIAKNHHDGSLGFDIIAADKDRRLLDQLGWINHHIGVDGVE